MKILKYIFELTNELKGLISGLGALILCAIVILGIAGIFGCIGYYLFSVAFPMYFEFGWHWWRFLALGFLMMLW